eukprot:scaffold1505_cov256-Pinguiococcus_pyrenoidosus.AAC.7
MRSWRRDDLRPLRGGQHASGPRPPAFPLLDALPRWCHRGHHLARVFLCVFVFRLLLGPSLVTLRVFFITTAFAVVANVVIAAVTFVLIIVAITLEITLIRIHRLGALVTTPRSDADVDDFADAADLRRFRIVLLARCDLHGEELGQRLLRRAGCRRLGASRPLPRRARGFDARSFASGQVLGLLLPRVGPLRQLDVGDQLSSR